MARARQHPNYFEKSMKTFGNSASDLREDPSATSAEPMSRHLPINIWVVDDNQGIRKAMMELLNEFDGVQCQATFSSPNAVLSTLASKPGPDVILLDIQMGEASGLDAIRPIKALSRSTQVLMFTTCADFESQKLAMTSGASGFLLKHFTAERILDSIHHASQNPVPHLKRTQNSANRRNAAVQTETKKLHWFRQWLDFMHLRRN
jgi:DNA-binding NtrC family response regulator